MHRHTSEGPPEQINPLQRVEQGEKVWGGDGIGLGRVELGGNGARGEQNRHGRGWFGGSTLPRSDPPTQMNGCKALDFKPSIERYCMVLVHV